ncbi:MAG TPA: hypothetical protein VN328_03730 [Thermodesulfovibrionales bacterium]|nr:hypothetical protein [Thermodesulfovibrionales bacterium]
MTKRLKNRPKEPPVPRERHETIRREIADILENRLLSAKDISGSVGVSAKEVYEHLAHIQKSLSKKGHLFNITPAECKKCGFAFSKRERLRKPGKCPVCRSETIEEPLFSIRVTGNIT